MLETDSAWSPTSPLEYKPFPNSGTSSSVKSLIKPLDLKSWDCNSVGLGLVNSLADDTAPWSRTVLLGLEARMNTLSSKFNLNLLECNPESSLEATNTALQARNSILVSEIVDSEDYTCVISRGPNPKTTHIFGDFILETRTEEIVSPLAVESSEEPILEPCGGIFGMCGYCKKTLGEGEDIYMFRGEEAFCSSDCRERFIKEEIEEEMNTKHCSSSSFSSSYSGDCFFQITSH
ncbi:protein MARD1-like [Ananas comosus]|uniref:Protein MARD1-like n=1 Tax=Ananas comosus TaxID=4615 RepID=A0A6P5GIY8_ANACO|nr:protein MARD1-like [Ananas comosus]